ncbi:MAG: hypothetical protein CL561_06470 [Alphaproteobacteria bacterium]|nr:hypothetical protein [Alphaproteobacteria bacterium]|tara:strand:- start:401 stop:697 length:297 start_codon:yes stop_codon:yes gene_type:complete
MGSLVSKPKAPQPVRVQYVTVPSATSTTTTTSGSGSASSDQGTDTTTTEGLSEKEASTLRAENIARRTRGRAGTVKTSFGGLLGRNDIVPTRKSLLGE